VVEQQRKTKIISLYGGPGIGKSTSGALLYWLLKNKLQANAELVREYVKNWAWEGRHIQPYDQFLFTAKQIRLESILLGRADYVVTDSPVFLTVVYAKKYTSSEIAEGIEQAVRAYYRQVAKDGHQHVHVMLARTKPYKQEGRYETALAAQELDRLVVETLEGAGVAYQKCGTDPAELEQLLVQVTGGA